MELKVFKDWYETRLNTHSAWSYERDYKLQSGLVIDFLSGNTDTNGQKRYVDIDVCVTDWAMAEEAVIRLLTAKREITSLLDNLSIETLIVMPAPLNPDHLSEYMGIELWGMPIPHHVVYRRNKHVMPEITAFIGYQRLTPVESRIAQLEYQLEISQRNTSILLQRATDIETKISKRRNLDKSGFIYLIRETTGYYKIGRAKNPANRLRTFDVKLPFMIEYEHLIPCHNRIDAEKQLHERYNAVRIPNTEWFALTPDQVAEIKAIERM